MIPLRCDDCSAQQKYNASYECLQPFNCALVRHINCCCCINRLRSEASIRCADTIPTASAHALNIYGVKFSYSK